MPRLTWTALDVRVIPYDPTPAGDSVVVYAGTQTNTQSAHHRRTAQPGLRRGPTERHRQCRCHHRDRGTEPGTPTLFAAGDTVYITDKATISAATAEEYATVASVAAPSGGTQVVTLGAALANSYGGSGTARWPA